MGVAESTLDEGRVVDCRIVIVCSRAGEDSLSELSNLPPNARIVATGLTLAELQAQDLDEKFTDANVLLNMSGTRETLAPIIRHLPYLTWVHSVTAGVDHLLCAELVDDESIVVTNAKGVFSESLAEYVLGACSYFAKDIPRLVRQKSDKLWDRYCVKQLRGATLGIVGYGSIGRACAKLAKAYDMNVIGLRRRPSESLDDPYVDEVMGFEQLHALLARSDYVAVAVALTPETKSMFNAAQFDHCKAGQVFINISRGPVVVEKDLAIALSSGKLHAAALDVFSVEPLPASSPLWDLSNVLISPHNADMTVDFRHRSVRLFCENCFRFLSGEQLHNIVDKKAGY